jgi:23S rRNA pseudouridine1911/1915/1917 synthase
VSESPLLSAALADLGPPSVLWMDAGLLAVDKPAGLPVHATPDPRRVHLTAQVNAWLAATQPGTRAVLAHRLDADTSGLTLFVIDRALVAAMAAAFAERRVHKTYTALVVPPPADLAPEKHFSVRDNLGPLPRARAKDPQLWGAVHAGGKPAHTDFEVRRKARAAWWIGAHPLTGRTHQIRAHLAERGLPILGDPLYGDATSAPRLMLHAEALAFAHPVSGEPIDLRCPAPRDFHEVFGG